MAARRVSAIASRAIFASCRQTAPRGAALSFRNAAPIVRSLPSGARVGGVQVRWHTASGSDSKVYDFDAVGDKNGTQKSEVSHHIGQVVERCT